MKVKKETQRARKKGPEGRRNQKREGCEVFKSVMQHEQRGRHRCYASGDTVGGVVTYPPTSPPKLQTGWLDASVLEITAQSPLNNPLPPP